jgi:hypothetical protein
VSSGGTLIVRLSSIPDGCDGEVARLKLLSSEAGRWFDLLVEKSQEPGHRPFGDTACLRLVHAHGALSSAGRIITDMEP